MTDAVALAVAFEIGFHFVIIFLNLCNGTKKVFPSPGHFRHFLDGRGKLGFRHSSFLNVRVCIGRRGR